MFIKALNLKELTKIVFCILFAVFLISMPSISLSGMNDGFYLCLKAVIPSVFPFMVLSKYIVYSGYALKLSGVIGKPLGKLFGFPQNAASALILGITGGYPIGAAAICDMVKSGVLSKRSGELMLGYCNNASPLFVIGTVGTVLLKNTGVGIVIYIIHIISSLICALMFKHSFTQKADIKKSILKKNTAPFVSAVSDSSSAILNICGYILFFSVVSKFITIIPFKSDLTAALISSVLELSNGVLAISCLTLNHAFKYALISAALGFSGICVCLQVSATVKDAGLSVQSYIKCKLICAVISFVLTFSVFCRG